MPPGPEYVPRLARVTCDFGPPLFAAGPPGVAGAGLTPGPGRGGDGVVVPVALSRTVLPLP